MSSSGDIALVKRKLTAGERGLKKMPSEYFLSNLCFSTQPITIPKKTEAFLLTAGDVPRSGPVPVFNRLAASNNGPA